jgi:hypothetical protein
MAHAFTQCDLRPVNQHIHVATREPQRIRYIFTRPLFEKPQRNDRALDAAQARYARAQTHDFFGMRQKKVGTRIVARHILSLVRERSMVPATEVTRGILHHRFDGREFVIARFMPRVIPREKGHQRVLHALERFFGIEPLGTRHRK